MPLSSSTRRTLRRYAPFLFWVVWFYAAWLVAVMTGDLWDEVASHWQTALAMALGSYVAGSTPMGGGTIGFPVLVLLMDREPSLGRYFSFMVQSVGMSSASLYLFCAGRPIAGRMLRWAMLGSTVSLPVSLLTFVDHVPGDVVKLAFACVWAGFAIVTLVKLRSLLQPRPMPRLPISLDRSLGLGVGVLGGAVAALTGVGIDMVLYTVLVLVYRCDLKAAVATSIVIMAYNSLVGSVTSAAMGRLEPEVIYFWLDAAPVVLLGAPFGALMLNVMRRDVTLIIVSMLCLAQLVWTLLVVRADATMIAVVLLVVLGMNGVFHLLHVWGGRIRHRPAEIQEGAAGATDAPARRAE